MSEVLYLSGYGWWMSCCSQWMVVGILKFLSVKSSDLHAAWSTQLRVTIYNLSDPNQSGNRSPINLQTHVSVPCQVLSNSGSQSQVSRIWCRFGIKNSKMILAVYLTGSVPDNNCLSLFYLSLYSSKATSIKQYNSIVTQTLTIQVTISWHVQTEQCHHISLHLLTSILSKPKAGIPIAISESKSP